MILQGRILSIHVQLVLNKLIHRQEGEISNKNIEYLRRLGEDLFRLCLNFMEGYKSLEKIIFTMDNGQKTKKNRLRKK